MSCEGWKKVKLGDVANIFDSLHQTPKYSEKGFQMIRVTDIKEGYLNANSAFRVSEDIYKEFIRKYKPQQGDILMSRVGTYGVCSYVKKESEFCLGQNTVVINAKLSGKYLYYALISRHTKNYIEEAVTGSTQKTISLKSIKEIPLFFPSLQEQKAIADTLSALDDKIELNNKINKNLEEMAQVIFKSWFVDFEPFQDGEFVESELGLIPKGWEFGKVDDYFNITIGKTPPRKEPRWFTVNSSDIKWLSIADIGKNGMYTLSTSEFLTQNAIEKFNVKVVKKDTVVLSFKLTVGRVAIANENVTTNEAIAHFNTTNVYLREYTYNYLKQFNYQSLGNTSSIATAVNSKTIRAMPFLMPLNEVIKNFHILVKPLFEQIRNNEEEKQRLSQLRDALLPKLMSGEIRVPLEGSN